MQNTEMQLSEQKSEPSAAKALGRRAQKVQDRKDNILTVSARLFRERGFHAVTMDEIGLASGMTGPAMYKYFDDKGAILAALLDRGIRIAFSALEALEIEHVSDLDALEQRVWVFIDFADAVRDASVVAVREVNSVPEWYREEFLENQRKIREINVEILMRIRPELSKNDARYICTNVFQGLISSSVYLYPADSIARKKRLAAMALAALLA